MTKEGPIAEFVRRCSEAGHSSLKAELKKRTEAWAKIEDGLRALIACTSPREPLHGWALEMLETVQTRKWER